MVIDSSAIVAILLDEPSGPALEAAVLSDTHCLISVASVLEVSIALAWRKIRSGEHAIDAVLESLGATATPVDREQLTLARNAYQRFGKGRHPAALNFGDCFSYALARQTGEPLLFVGNDFSRTDIPVFPWT